MKLCNFWATAVAGLLTAVGSMLHAQTLTTLWMADETNGRLWAFTDYSAPSTTTAFDWGELQWFDGSAWQPFPGGTEKNIEGMAVTAAGFAYFSVNRTLGSTTLPVLMSVDLAGLVWGTGTVQLQTIGTIRDTGGTPSALDVEALAYHQASGTLYGLRGDTGSGIDSLIQIDTATGIYTDLGQVTGLGQSLTHFDGLEFIGSSLYAYDNDDNHLYQINYSGSGALISAVIDNDVGDGLGSTDIEGLVYDPLTGRLLAIDNSGNHAIHHITLDNGNNSTVSTFVGGTSPIPSNADFEGGAFFVREVPEPSGALLVACAGLLMAAGRRRAR